MDAVAATYRMVDAFAAELRRLGVRHVCLCPGSRSTPLALAFARHGVSDGELFKLWVHLDERSAAYFALGLAKAAREPAALVCTSGTAAANFLPAVIEAHQARVPLVVCTADRPPELHGVGANQTIPQAGIYCPHVRLAIDLPVPDAQPAVARFAVVAARRALAAARGAPAGPVHLNFPFREPLVPSGPLPPPTPLAPTGAWLSIAADGAALASGRQAPAADLSAPLPPPQPTPRQAASADLEALAEMLATARRGLIVCGEQADPAFPFAVAALARLLRFPVLADPLSGVRRGPHHSPLIIDSYDALLRDAAFAASVQPDCILRFGAAPTSKPLLQYLEANAECPQVLIGEEGWLDPTLTASAHIAADPTLTGAALSALLEDHEPARATVAWAEQWQASAAAARAALDEGVAAFTAPFEGRVFTELARLLPPGALLFAGNSMPVRDLDTFFPGGDRPVQFLANRGASGIDGVVSSAFGAAAAGLGPVLLVIGDLSFYHDMNGLLAAKRFGLDLTIVLVNNDGGGIFSFLPQAAQPEHFEQLFGTPHGLDFAPVAALYGARYVRPQTWRDFVSAVGDGVQRGGLSIVEVRTERTANVRQHRVLWSRVSAALAATGAVAGVAGGAVTRLTVNGLDVHFTERGRGAPLVLLHGFTGSAGAWGDCLDALAAQHRVIAVDLVGHGETAAPAALDHYRMPAVVADLAALLDALDLPTFALLGYSMGGRAALHFAAAHPARVRALLLESASPGLADSAERAARIARDEALADRIMSAGLDAFVAEWEQLPLFRTQERLPVAVRAAHHAQRLHNRSLGLANSLRGMGAGAQEPLWAALTSLSLPVLLLTGAEDAKYGALAAAMAARLPRASSVVVPGAGHTVHLEQPRAFVGAATSFLAAVEPEEPNPGWRRALPRGEGLFSGRSAGG